MPIPATCPSCNTSYQLADTMRGKRVRCKSCSEVFDVRDEDTMRIQASPRPDTRVAREEDDDDRDRPPVRRRPVKKSRNNSAVPLLIVVCVVLGILVLGVGGIAVWAFARSRQPQPPPEVANFNRPAPVPQPAQAPPQNPGGMPPQQAVPPFENPMPAQGPLAAQLTNANISGFGAQIEVTADYRFTSGNPGGRRIVLFIKATKAMGFIQKENYYVAELHSIGNKTQGTIRAAGMTFGLEQGPFEMWLGEGPGGLGPLIAEKDLRKISNVVTVAGKQPGMPGMPGFPGMRPPFGPRGVRP